MYNINKDEDKSNFEYARNRKKIEKLICIKYKQRGQYVLHVNKKVTLEFSEASPQN